jgi:hypothetical protein
MISMLDNKYLKLVYSLRSIQKIIEKSKLKKMAIPPNVGMLI